MRRKALCFSALLALSEFAADQRDRIAALDVNPLICSGQRITAVDALIILQRTDQ